jgi:branched-chain amino acid transport system permease protein
LRVILFSPFGYALRALRDSEPRAETIGMRVSRMQWAASRSPAVSPASPARSTPFSKAAYFPTISASRLSIDGLVMVLLGGVGTVSGGVVGAACL